MFTAEEIEAMSKGLAKTDTTTAVVTETAPVTEVAETTAQETKTPESSLTTEVKTETAPEVKTEEVKVEKTEAPATKSFEEYLTERSGGKFKDWTEVEKLINGPKDEFADDSIRHLNSLAKSGVKITQEVLELQSKDYENMFHQKEIILEAMKLKPEYKGLSDKTLELKLNEKYKYSEWADKEDSDLTEEEVANDEIMRRDALNDKEWLINYRNERLLVKKPDEAQLKLQADSQKLAQENWEKFVDNELFSKVTNLSVTIDEGTKEAFDYKISESDRKEISGTMKLLTKDSGVLFNQFAEKDGSGNLQINHRKVFEMLVKNKAFDEAVKHAYRDGKAEGAKKEIKDLKNISFKPNESQPTNAAPKTEAEAIALAMKTQGKKL